MQTDEVAEQAAVTAAEKWLALVDIGNYAESWSEAASLFKSAISVQHWQASLEAAQAPLGKSVSRQLKSKQYAEELPGAPDGEYVIIEYETSFERKKNGQETITPMKDTDGEWRVSGYYIK